jgi:uncharacterized membrane protein
VPSLARAPSPHRTGTHGAEATLPTVSGGPGSLAPREGLDAEGLRFLDGAVPGETIRRVLASESARNPVRVYVGLGSARSPGERVRLAVGELERLGAFERRRVVVASPTGMGFLNAVPIEAEELMSGGDVATVVVQYGNQRSWRSRRRVPDGRQTHRLLLEALRVRLGRARRPEVAVYAESLGAWASLAAYDGPEDLEALGVGRGLWVGVPFDARAHLERVAPPQAPEAARFEAASEMLALPLERRRTLRRFFLTRPTDPVSTFEGPRVALRPPRVRREGERWLPLVTFTRSVRVIVRATDFPSGRLGAEGHDYRGELAVAVRTAFDHHALPDASFAHVEAALLAREQARANAQVGERA